MDLYLGDGGTIGVVMPHSALRSGQHEKWRSGRWQQLVRTGKRTSRVDRLRVDFRFKNPWDLEQLKPNDFFPIPASVVFARRQGADPTAQRDSRAAAPARPLAGEVERWEGHPGDPDVTREVVALGAGMTGGNSPYHSLAANGATLYPRRLFMVEGIENPARIRAPGTIMVNPRRGKQDKAPWRDLDLAAISNVTIENVHVFDVYLGESVAPYVTLAPLLAVLPVQRSNGDVLSPSDTASAVGGVNLRSLERRMRQRWRTITGLWDANKGVGNERTLLENLDYLNKLSTQIEWRETAGDGACRVVYTKSGRPTAARLWDRDAIVENTLYWMPCGSDEEASYLLAVINSDALRDAAEPLMSRGLWGARDLHKHLWALPIPRFNPRDALHAEVAAAGDAAAEGAAEQLDGRDALTGAAARKLLRQWLADSPEGREVERAVGELLAGAD